MPQLIPEITKVVLATLATVGNTRPNIVMSSLNVSSASTPPVATPRHTTSQSIASPTSLPVIDPGPSTSTAFKLPSIPSKVANPPNPSVTELCSNVKQTAQDGDDSAEEALSSSLDTLPSQDDEITNEIIKAAFSKKKKKGWPKSKSRKGKT